MQGYDLNLTDYNELNFSIKQRYNRWTRLYHVVMEENRRFSELNPLTGFTIIQKHSIYVLSVTNSMGFSRTA